MAKDSTVEEGTQESPNSEGSDNQQGQRGSAADNDVVKQLALLQSQFDKLQRSLQGEKDRSVKRTNQRLDKVEGDLRAVLQVAQQKGQSVSDVLSELDEAEEMETRTMLREMAQAFKSGRFVQGASHGSDEQENDIASAVVKDLELPEEDIRVKEFRSRSFSSEAEALREGAKLLKTISTLQPSDADRSSDVAGRQVSQSKQEALMAEYKEGSKDLYGNALIRYKKAMRAKGLEIT